MKHFDVECRITIRMVGKEQDDEVSLNDLWPIHDISLTDEEKEDIVTLIGEAIGTELYRLEQRYNIKFPEMEEVEK